MLSIGEMSWMECSHRRREGGRPKSRGTESRSIPGGEPQSFRAEFLAARCASGYRGDAIDTYLIEIYG
jgi:hypothetical protein